MHSSPPECQLATVDPLLSPTETCAFGSLLALSLQSFYKSVENIANPEHTIAMQLLWPSFPPEESEVDGAGGVSGMVSGEGLTARMTHFHQQVVRHL